MSPLTELKKSSVQYASPVSTFQEAERQAIIDALKAASGRISGPGAAAERLGLSAQHCKTKCGDSTSRKPITEARMRSYAWAA
jgi:transcriptional regulator with GAF, ATPase, and Fis domain